MSTGTKWILIGVGILLFLFIIFGVSVPVKTQAYTVRELYTVTEKYIEKEPYEVTERYQVPMEYTYMAPCKEERPMYGYECCRPPGSPGGIAPYPQPGDPAYNPYARINRPPVRYCEYTGTRLQTVSRTVIKFREVEKTRSVPTLRTVTKYRTVPLFSCAPPPN